MGDGRDGVWRVAAMRGGEGGDGGWVVAVVKSGGCYVKGIDERVEAIFEKRVWVLRGVQMKVVCVLEWCYSRFLWKGECIC